MRIQSEDTCRLCMKDEEIEGYWISHAKGEGYVSVDLQTDAGNDERRYYCGVAWFLSWQLASTVRSVGGEKLPDW